MGKRIVIFAFFVLAFNACVREQKHPVNRDTLVCLCLPAYDAKTTVSIPDGEGKRSVFWSEGDVVSRNGTESNALDEKYDGASNAVFVFQSEDELPYRILYPGSIYADNSHIILPSVQQPMPGSDDFASGAVPMAGYVERADEQVIMEHLCAAVRIRWKQASSSQDNDRISYVEFAGGAEEQVCGRFLIDYPNAVLTGTDVSGSKTVRVFSGKSQSSRASVTNIVIPPGNYPLGFKIRVVDVQGHYMEKSFPSEQTFNAGYVYSFPVFEFIPTGTLLEIDSQEALLSWASGEQFKDADSKVVLTADIDLRGKEWTAFPFAGIFDGQGHSITNIKVEKDGDANFFNSVSGTVRNVIFGSFYDGSVFRSKKSATDNFYVAPIRDATGTAVIENVTSFADVEFLGTGTGVMIGGGIVGKFASTATLSHCVFAGNLKIDSNLGSASNIGGICGTIVAGGTVKSCLNKGYLEISKSYSHSLNYGAVVGYCSASASIINCINSGTIKISGTASPIGGQTSMGGILGYNNAAPCTLSGCTNRGIVWKENINTTRNSFVGGIVGYSNQAMMIKSCSNEEVALVKNTAICSKQLAMGGIIGGLCPESQSSLIENCTNQGKIINTALCERYIGGIVGKHAPSTDSESDRIISSINSGVISDQISGGILLAGGIAGQMTSSTSLLESCSATGDIDVPASRLSTCGALCGIHASSIQSWSICTGISVCEHILTDYDIRISVLQSNNYRYLHGTDSSGSIVGDMGVSIDDLEQSRDDNNW